MFAIDVCSGAGGLSRGLELSGFRIVAAVEADPYAAGSYRANFPESELIEADIRDVCKVTKRCRAAIGHEPLVALVGGLPCQGFSESNRRTRSRSNKRNHLYRTFARLLESLGPRWFILENVAGVATLESGAFLDEMMNLFERCGYIVAFGVLDAADFGVPQIRRRAFIVGNCVEGEFRFPSVDRDGGSERSSVVTVSDAIADLPDLPNGSGVDVKGYQLDWKDSSAYARSLRDRRAGTSTGHVVSRNMPHVLARYRHVRPGGNWRSIPLELMSNYSNLDNLHTGIYYRLSWDTPSKVIGNFRKNMLIHPSEDRGLSIREAARLQSFPDQHVFLGPLNDRQQQVGDAVPPLLAKAVGDALVAVEQQMRNGR